jgi:CRISPR system Cascade subunit CasE
VAQGRKVKSRELDAFTHAQIHRPDITREEAYSDWLRKQLAGAAEVSDCRVAELRTERMHRKGGGPFAHPNVVLEGGIQVTAEETFSALLARGVGRHRAFGFGMLLLRPAR